MRRGGRVDGLGVGPWLNPGQCVVMAGTRRHQQSCHDDQSSNRKLLSPPRRRQAVQYTCVRRAAVLVTMDSGTSGAVQTWAGA